MIRIKLECAGQQLMEVHNVEQAPAIGRIVSIGPKQYEVVDHRTEYASPENVNSVTVVVVKEASAPKGTRAAHGKKELRG